MEKMAFIIKENGKLVTAKRNWIGPDIVALCPKDENGKWITEIEALTVTDEGVLVDLNKLKEVRAKKAKEYLPNDSQNQPQNVNKPWWRIW